MSWTDLFHAVSLLLALIVAGIGFRLVIKRYRPRSTAIAVALGGVALTLSGLANLSSFDLLVTRLGQRNAVHNIEIRELEKLKENVAYLEARDGNTDQSHSQILTKLQNRMEIIDVRYKRSLRRHDLNIKEMAKDGNHGNPGTQYLFT